MKPQKSILDNGLTVLTYEMSEVFSATAILMVRAGSRNEKDKEAGIAHFIEHILFKGTKKYPTTLDLSGAIERIGGRQNAWTDVESTGYFIQVPFRHINLALEILNQQLFHSLLDAKEIEREKGVVMQEINMYNDEPASWVQELLAENAWPNSSLGRTTLGYKETITGFSRDMILDFMERLYNPANMILSVAGKVRHKNIVALSKKAFSIKAKTSKEEALAKARDFQPAFKASSDIKLQFRKTDQTHLALGFYGFSRSDKERIPQTILSVILGGGLTSRLFTEVREKRGLAYAIHSGTRRFQDIGALVIYAGLNNEKTFEALKIIMAEIEKIKKEKVGQKELFKVKEFIKGNLALDLESTNRVAAWFGDQELLDPKTLSYAEIVKEIDAVTSTDIQKVAQKIFERPFAHLAVIGPFKNKEEFGKILI